MLRKESNFSNYETLKGIQKLQELAKALHCPTRWDIMDIIGSETAKTREIREGLEERGYDLTQSGLYYRLSELRDSDLIEVSEYVEEGKGAPEKVKFLWSMKPRLGFK